MRATVEEVKQIIDTALGDEIIMAYLTSSKTLIDEVLEDKVSETLLKEIERWLAAHMIASTRERQAIEEGAGGAVIKYSGIYGDALRSTSYGQMVLTLDTSGTFKAMIDPAKRASIRNVKGH